jgi:glutamate-ammonia-ligase adenylyltransferase
MAPSTTSPSLKLSSVALRHRKTTEDIFINSGLGEIAPQFFASLNDQLSRSPDDAMTMTNFLRFLESSFNPTTILRDLAQHSILLETLLSIFGASQYFSDILIRDPELFRWLTATTVLESARSKNEFFVGARQSAEPFESFPRKVNALKRFQRREMLRIGVRDILHLADLETTTRELSNLADAIIGLASELTWSEMRIQFGGAPYTEWAIFGLGKLGGEELNYSSDIDLIAVFNVDGDIPPSGKMTHGEFFVRFIEQIVLILSHPTAEGHFYRVDMRLRPDGKSGALIRSFDSTLMYYESRGELWERQMLIKARRVAGDEAFAKRFLDALGPFVYPRTFFENPIEEISRIKTRIESHSDDRNIKLRAGGIRDIEFIVQALQLVNGGRNPSIRNANTIAALRLLHTASLVSSAEAAQIEEAYIFFRTLEHRLQMLEYAQTHSLPVKKHDRERLAAWMAMSPATFDASLQLCLHNVRRVFDNVFTHKAARHHSDIERFLSGKSDSQFSQSFAHNYSLHDIEQTVRKLRGMMYGSTVLGKKEYTAQTRTHFKRIAEPFLEEIAVSVAPDRALANAERVLSSFLSPDAMYALLAEKNFRRTFVTICARSGMMAKHLSLSPGLAETVLTGIENFLREESIPEPRISRLHQWKIREECKAAVRYILGSTDEQTLFHSLSEIASRAMELLYEKERKKLKVPGSTQFCILGLGKLGGYEINFGSDLDVVLLFEAKRKSDAEKCEKLAANLITACSRVTEVGKLYDIDARLRPEGRNAPLAVAGEQYIEYLHHRASLWERQSLTRARTIAGDRDFSSAILASILNSIYTRPLPKGWTEEILSMRRKTETRSRTSSSDFFDIKLGGGGMMDVEFAVQALQLHRGKNALPSTNMYELLEMYSRDSTNGTRVAVLNKNYRLMRRIETALRLGLDVNTHLIPGDGESLDYLARISNFASAKELHSTIRTTMKETRTTFESILLSLK